MMNIHTKLRLPISDWGLIIIFVIIFAVLKRIKEIAKKESEIKDRAPAPPAPFPELAEELKQRFEQLETEMIQPEAETLEPEIKPAVFEREIFEEKRPEFIEPVIQPEPELLPDTELRPEIEVPLRVEEPVSVAKKEFIYKKAVPREKYQAAVLNFRGPAVVNGIIMSEILGPPVSMR